MKRTLFWTVAIALVACRPTAAQTCGKPGLYAGIDLLFLSPKFTDQSVVEIFYSGDQVPDSAECEGSFDAPLEMAQRVTLGYQGDAGGGVRFRWFSFDNSMDYVGSWENGGPEIPLIGTANLDVDSIDAELTQTGSFRMWNLTGAVGARVAQISLIEEAINFEDVPAFLQPGDTGAEFNGAGPTIFVEGCRPILIDGLSIFGNVRTSILFGDSSSIYSAFESDYTILVHNDYMQVWEIQAGTRYLCPVTDSIDFVSGIFWEAQRWESDAEYLNLAFHGFGAQFGFLF